MLRKFSSEGALLDLDYSSRRQGDEDGTRDMSEEEMDCAPASYPCTPDAMSASAGKNTKGELNRDHSISVENLTGLEKDSDFLKVTNFNDSFKAYSDSQLAPNAKGSFESVEKCDNHSHSPSSSLKSSHSPASSRPPHYHRQQARAKLAAAKLHIKSLFGQVRVDLGFLSHFLFQFFMLHKL